MKLFINALFLITSNCILSQDILDTKFETVKNESLKYNDIVSAGYYKDLPIILMISRTEESYDYSKSYMFHDNICISETYFYPKDLLQKRYDYLTAHYTVRRS